MYYDTLKRLQEEGYVQKVHVGCYIWVGMRNFSEAGMMAHLFPDGIFCMDTALYYYGYLEEKPKAWHIAVSKDSSKSRFKMKHIEVHPYYLEPYLVDLGLTEGEIDGKKVRIYDRERVVCDCIRYRNRIDHRLFTQAVRQYVRDPEKDLERLHEYANILRVSKMVNDLIEMWI